MLVFNGEPSRARRSFLSGNSCVHAVLLAQLPIRVDDASAESVCEGELTCTLLYLVGYFFYLVPDLELEKQGSVCFSLVSR